MRRVDYLITDIRRISRNDPNPDGTTGTTDEEILEYINEGQDRLQALICSAKNVDRIFVSEIIMNLVQSQEAYLIPDRIYMNRTIHQVEFSSDGGLGNYIVLDKIETFNRDTNSSQYVVGYNRRGGQIYVTPIPSSNQGTLRILYDRTLDDLDKRRGKISTVTGLTSTGFTSITLDSSADETSNPSLSSIDYICIIDANGNRRAFNIPVASYNTGTNVLTPGTFTFANNETIAAGDYVVFSKWKTTHPNSLLPDDAERYLINYAVEMLLHKDSSNDMPPQSLKLEQLERDIIDSISSQTGEVQRIPQFNRYEWW